MLNKLIEKIFRFLRCPIKVEPFRLRTTFHIMERKEMVEIMVLKSLSLIRFFCIGRISSPQYVCIYMSSMRLLLDTLCDITLRITNLNPALITSYRRSGVGIDFRMNLFRSFNFYHQSISLT